MNSKQIVWTGILAAAFVAASLTFAEDTILERHMEAVGGTEALDAMKSLKRSGSVSMSGKMGEAAGTFEEVTIPGQKAYATADLGVYAEKSGWNGKSAWQENTFEGLRDLEGDQAEVIRSQIDLDPIATIYRAYGAAAFELSEDETENGEEVQVVKVVDEPLTFYIDPKTNLITHFETTYVDQGLGEAMLKISFLQYGEYDGVKLPDELGIDIGDGMIVLNYTYEKTEVNPEVDEAIFEKPAQ